MEERDAKFDRMQQEAAREKQERDAELARMQQEAAREMQETRRLMKERDAVYDRMRKELNSKLGALGNRIGDIIEHMLGGRIIEKFNALGYAVKDRTRNHFFEMSKLGIKGEIDLILHDGDVSILIEVKTTLETADVRKFLDAINGFRIYVDARWKDVPRRFIGAVAGAVVEGNAIKFAHENGLYTIVQSGEAVDMVPVPEGFKAQEW
jgi:hypothetical protein